MSQKQLPEPVNSFIDHVNAHDEKAFDTSFSAEPVVDDWGRTFTGLDEIKAWSDKEFIGSNGVLTVEEVTTAPDTVTVVGDWRSTHANGRSQFTFAISGDKIAKMTIREG